VGIKSKKYQIKIKKKTIFLIVSLSRLIGKGTNCLDGSISKRYFILPKQSKVNEYAFHIRKKGQHKYHENLNHSSKISKQTF
jgi:hypothetical protein